jgi:hypothetical protein
MVVIEPPLHSIFQSHLKVEGWLVTENPFLTESLEDSTYVLMLVFDRRTRSANLRLKIAIVLGLVVGTPGDIVGQHREVIRDDQIVLLIGPRLARH